MNKAAIAGAIAGAAIIIGIVLAVSYDAGQVISTEPSAETESSVDWEGGAVWMNLLVSNSEEYAVYNEQSRIVLDLAVEDFNAYLNEEQSPWQFDPIAVDFDTDPNEALEQIYADGLVYLEELGEDPQRYPFQTFVVGPATSSAVEQILDYETNDILLISHASTAPSLAIPDNIFRLVPDDTKQAKATARAISDAGISVVIPIYRGNIWGTELHSEIFSTFSAMGGTMNEGIQYGPDEADFSDEAQMLSEKVVRYIDQGYTTEDLAILVISYDEVTSILDQSASYDNLVSITWFGSDSTARSIAVTDDPAALGFAEEVGLISPSFLVTQNEKTKRIDDVLLQETGSLPDNSMYSLYDAIWIHGLAIEQSRTLNIEVLVEILPVVAEEYDGAIGSITFNEAGDLASANYELFWIQNGAWESYGIYTASDDKITRDT